MAHLLLNTLVLGFFLCRGTGYRTSEERKKEIKEYMKFCQTKFGKKYYYDDVSNFCCPCTSCGDSYAVVRIVECGYGNDNCVAKYHEDCMRLADDPPTSIVTVAMPDTTAATTFLLSNSTTSIAPAKRNVNFVIVATLSSALVFVLVLGVMICCLCHQRDIFSHVKKEFPCFRQHSGNGSATKQEQRKLVSQQESVDNQAPRSMDGPPEMMLANQITSASKSYSPPEPCTRENSRDDSDLPHRGVDRHRQPSSLPNTGMYHQSQANVDTPYIIGFAQGHGSVHIDTVTIINQATPNWPVRQASADDRAFCSNESDHAGIPETHSTREMNRQSSEASSTSSGPVENGSLQPWDTSISRGDQIREYENCRQQSNNSRMSSVESSTSQGPVQHSSDACFMSSERIGSRSSHPEGDLSCSKLGDR